MTDATEIETKVLTHPQRSHPGCAGRPMRPERARRQLELARHAGRKALLVALRRMTAHLANPATPVDSVYLGMFRELASRCGLPAFTAQTVATDSRTLTVSATMDPDEIQARAKMLLAEVIEGERREHP